LVAGAFEVDTCQRRLWIYSAHGQDPLAEQVDILRGEKAYLFLLRVATGLESEIRGETDIFGQLKEAWRWYETSDEAYHFDALSPWMQRLFEDTKDVRAQHLQNVGGSSYGSLIRILLKRYHSAPQEPLLIVGAGHIARAICPWLAEHELWIWNRGEESLKTLLDEVGTRPGARVRPLIGPEAEERAWREAAHAIVCIPYDAEGDGRRIRLWREGAAAGYAKGSVIHLGGLGQACGEWSTLNEFHPLDDLFSLQKEQNEARASQFARALRTCEEKARLRGLGGSLTLPHGWEDLAVFA
jgi:hypothetical protein